jgi:hypothetical protein
MSMWAFFFAAFLKIAESLRRMYGSFNDFFWNRSGREENILGFLSDIF